MGKKRKDTDYVYLSTRVKAMERGLLDRARAERVLAAPTEEAAARVLQECGYPDLAGVTGRALEAALAQRQREMLEDLAGDLPDRTVEEAAMIAAWNSRARAAALVPVDYTQAKNVRKPGGAKPGMVIFDHYFTLYTTPDEEKVAALEEK